MELQQLPEEQLQIQEPEMQQMSTTSTVPTNYNGYDSNIDDLEDIITATVVSKKRRQRSTIEQRTQQLNQHQQIMQQQQLQQQSHCSIQVKKQDINEYGSANMLIILDNGEQRLITFTLPKETCTVQELLDQVGIKVDIDSPIECIDNSGKEIDFIVKVGHCRAAMDTAAMIKNAENHVRQQKQLLLQQQQSKFVALPVDGNKTPEANKNIPAAKFVPGSYAICKSCGCSGLDHVKCESCQRIFTEEPTTVLSYLYN